MNTGNTSINTVPAIYRLVKNKFGWDKYSFNLDYGAGKYPENLSSKLENMEVINYSYDKYNKDKCLNWNDVKIPVKMFGRKFDTCTISNVLNVCPTLKERISIIKKCLTVTKNCGRIYITTYEGDKTEIGKKTTKGWQNNQPTKFYYNELKNVFDNVEIYGKLIVVTKGNVK